MKNIVAILIFITIVIIVIMEGSFFNSSEDINKAKQDLLIGDNVEEDYSGEDTLSGTQNGSPLYSMEDTFMETNSGVTSSINLDNSEASYKIEKLTQEQFLTIDDLSSRLKNLSDSIEITGKVESEVDKIVVSFSNKDSDFPNDNYILNQFKVGDMSFTYRAKSQFKVLDYGINEYVFNAYSGDKISKLLLTIIVPKKSENITSLASDIKLDTNINYEKKLLGTGTNKEYISLPKSSSFGTPLSSGENVITYSNISNLEILKEDITMEDVNCEKLTDYLGTRLNSLYFWNTCRDIIKDQGISYFVIKSQGDTYTYEKHYVDYKHGLYGVYILESGIAIDKENIKTEINDKNQELKAKNDTFTDLVIVDSLFKEIVR